MIHVVGEGLMEEVAPVLRSGKREGGQCKDWAEGKHRFESPRSGKALLYLKSL